MTETAERILRSIYQKSPYSDVQMQYSGESTQKSSELRAIQELEKSGLIIKSASALGFVVCRLTEDGRIYVETR